MDTEVGRTAGTATVNDQVRDTTQLVQDKAQGALGQARSRLRDQVDQRSTKAGEQVQSTAQDMRSMAEQLRGQGKDTPARVAEQVADRAESFGSYLRDADGERLLRDVENVARRQPWLIAAGGLALGFAASRFLKASSSRRYQTDNGSETPCTQADVVAPAVGSDPLATQPITPVTEPSEPFGSRRDPDPLP
jgi:hypothetical protein